jgi:hypothetical protein
MGPHESLAQATATGAATGARRRLKRAACASNIRRRFGDYLLYWTAWGPQGLGGGRMGGPIGGRMGAIFPFIMLLDSKVGGRSAAPPRCQSLSGRSTLANSTDGAEFVYRGDA